MKKKSRLDRVWSEFGESLEKSPNPLQTQSLFFKKKLKKENNQKKRIYLSLGRVWSEFGESLENLQIHSKLNLFFEKS